MATAVFLHLRDGRRIRLGLSRDAAGAAKMKNDVEQWISSGTILSMANARGDLEEIVLESIATIELDVEPTPSQGNAIIRPGSHAPIDGNGRGT